MAAAQRCSYRHQLHSYIRCKYEAILRVAEWECKMLTPKITKWNSLKFSLTFAHKQTVYLLFERVYHDSKRALLIFSPTMKSVGCSVRVEFALCLHLGRIAERYTVPWYTLIHFYCVGQTSYDWQPLLLPKNIDERTNGRVSSLPTWNCFSERVCKLETDGAIDQMGVYGVSACVLNYVPLLAIASTFF